MSLPPVLAPVLFTAATLSPSSDAAIKSSPKRSKSSNASGSTLFAATIDEGSIASLAITCHVVEEAGVADSEALLLLLSLPCCGFTLLDRPDAFLESPFRFAFCF